MVSILDQIQARSAQVYAGKLIPREDVIKIMTSDVPKLVAALRAVEAECEAMDQMVEIKSAGASNRSAVATIIRAAVRDALGGEE